MFLNLNFTGLSFVTSLNPTLPVPSKYNKITIYGGNTGSIISKVWGRNKLVSEQDVSDYDILTYKPKWDSDTYGLSEFFNNLDMGNITGLINKMTQWDISRKATGEKISTHLTTVDVDTKTHKDFTAVSSKDYNYYITAKNDEEISSPVVASVTPDYYGWFLIDEEKGISYKFDANLESGNLGYEEDVIWYNNNTEYPVCSKGKHNPMTIQIKAILFDPINLDNPYSYEQSNQILAELKEFIKSSRTKILKDRRGRIWRGETFGNNENQLHDGLEQQIVVTSFTFKETRKV